MASVILGAAATELVRNAPAIIRAIATVLPYAQLRGKEGEELQAAINQLVEASKGRAQSVVEREREHEAMLRKAPTPSNPEETDGDGA